MAVHICGSRIAKAGDVTSTMRPRAVSASESVTGASGVEGVSREAILKYRLICILISIATYSNIGLCEYRFEYGFIWIWYHLIIA